MSDLGGRWRLVRDSKDVPSWLRRRTNKTEDGGFEVHDEAILVFCRGVGGGSTMTVVVSIGAEGFRYQLTKRKADTVLTVPATVRRDDGSATNMAVGFVLDNGVWYATLRLGSASQAVKARSWQGARL